MFLKKVFDLSAAKIPILLLVLKFTPSNLNSKQHRR